MDITCVRKIGEGAFSEVHAADSRRLAGPCAVKRIFLKDAGEGRFPVLAFRELMAHRVLHGCPSIVPVHGWYISGGCLALVQPLYACDLAALCRPASPLPLAPVRSILRDVLTGVACMHRRGLLHRDIKPHNILLDLHGRAWVGDLGLARPMTQRGEDGGEGGGGGAWHWTAQVTSRWYRAPEILLGSSCYGPCIDTWAVGALAVELCTGKAMAGGGSDVEQISMVWAVRGTPTVEQWPEVESLPDWSKLTFSPQPPAPWPRLLPATHLCEHALAWLNGTLALRPQDRWTAEQALQAEWLQGEGCRCQVAACGQEGGEAWLRSAAGAHAHAHPR